MRTGLWVVWTVSGLSVVGFSSADAAAQQGPTPGGDPGASVSNPGGTGQVTITPGSTTTTTTTTLPPGYFQPGAPDPNEHLPASSRPTSDTSKSSDGFDMNRGSEGEGSVRGSKGSDAILSRGGAMRVPTMHTVRRGDTLWDLSGRYYGNSWGWPKVWSYNPQINNPHWIYPGDQVRMKLGGDPRDTSEGLGGKTLGGGRGGGPGGGPGGGGGGEGGRAGIPQGTIVLRSTALLDDPKRQSRGELVGAREDQMLLSEGNHVYLQMKPGKDVKLGEKLTIYKPVRRPEAPKGSRRPPGQIIAIKGTVRVDQYNPKTHVARGKIVESVDAIERGALIGDVGREVEVVPPKPSRVDRWARVLTSVYPHEFFGQNQVVFIDRGTEDGISAGNRLFVVSKGDQWRNSLRTSKKEVRMRMKIDVPEHAAAEPTPLQGDEKKFPEEVIGELRVLRANKYSSVALVTVSHREIEPGDRAVARKGY